MKIFNSSKEYGLLGKLFHWITFLALLVQIPFGFYLVSLEFSSERIELENIHIFVGITIFYFTLFRLIAAPTAEIFFLAPRLFNKPSYLPPLAISFLEELYTSNTKPV